MKAYLYLGFYSLLLPSAKRSDQKGMTLLAIWFASLWQSLQLI